MEAMKTEIEEMYKQMVDIGNSKFKGKYVFNGQLTDIKPIPKQGQRQKRRITGFCNLKWDLALSCLLILPGLMLLVYLRIPIMCSSF